ncbi:MAG: hypothetical protein NTY46_02365 [Candidatus Sumerlaeota bacterium]|nr:hypothetical protein [Candidatus Sumerlaeota bacterium]
MNIDKSDKILILFIDTGDNCRCPMAKGYLLKLIEQRRITHIDIRTAGVMTPHGLLPTPEAVQLLMEEQVDIRRHRSRPLTVDMIRRADLVLGMTPFHVQMAYRMIDDARRKTFLLKEYVGCEGRNVQIQDPMGGTLEIFKKVFGAIKASLQKLVEMDIINIPPKRTQEAPRVSVAVVAVEQEQPAPPRKAGRPGRKPVKKALKVKKVLKTKKPKPAKTAPRKKTVRAAAKAKAPRKKRASAAIKPVSEYAIRSVKIPASKKPSRKASPPVKPKKVKQARAAAKTPRKPAPSKKQTTSLKKGKKR